MAKSRNAGFILMAVLFLALSWGCTADSLGGSASGALENGGDELPGTFEGLSTELEMRIRQDYFEQVVEAIFNKPNSSQYFESVNDVTIEGYYGTYNGCVVITTNLDSYDAAYVMTMEMDGWTIEFYGWRFCAWYDGKIYFDVSEAFAQGYLTQDDYRQIRERYLEFIGL